MKIYMIEENSPEEVTEEGVKDKIYKSGNGKPPGRDRINAEPIKHVEGSRDTRN